MSGIFYTKENCAVDEHFPVLSYLNLLICVTPEPAVKRRVVVDTVEPRPSRGPGLS